jgi:zinc protease
MTSTVQAKMAAKIERVVSPGGIVAWLVEEHTVPLISMEFAFRGGAAQDGADKSGTATMLAGLLDEGAGDLDGQAYQEKLEESAVELHFSAGRDSFDGSLKCLIDKSAPAFDLLRLAVTEARLEDNDVERIRQQILARIRRDSTDPGDVAYETWAAQAFPGHPYGQRPHGSETSVEGISRADLAAFRTANFARDNLVIAVVGAINAATLGPALDQIFGALPAEPKLKPVKPTAPQNVGRTEVIDMDIPQTTIVFGRGGLTREDPDYIAAVVMNHILGGGTFTSRLFNEVREKRGLAYSVYSYLDPMEHAGVIGGGVATKNERAAEALEIIESEFARFSKDGPTDDELAKAKLYLTGSYALNFDSSVKVARGLKQIQLTHLPVDYIDERNALVEAISVEDVKRVAARILGDGGLLVAAAGRPVGFRQGKAGAPVREAVAAAPR